MAGFDEYTVEYVAPDDNAEKIRTWLEAGDDTAEQDLRLSKLDSWLNDNTAKVNGTILDANTWLYAGRTAEYVKCIQNLQIN